MKEEDKQKNNLLYAFYKILSKYGMETTRARSAGKELVECSYEFFKEKNKK